MSINSVLFNTNSSLREPALLNLDKTSNYDSLASYLASEETSASTITDKVDLAMDKVADKIITELAGITAETIGDYPDLGDDYVVAIIDGEGGREVRVYSRQEIIEASQGTEEEKKALAEQLAKEPLVAYSSAEGLPASSQNEASLALADKISSFLKINSKLLDSLEKYGYNPFTALMNNID
ncbi:MAG: hypothetical protein LBJ61_13110 [Deltaproteobacteria bacterium]|nr:hypothetical protein [Deltaproteobacteria bacterium]